MKVLSAVFVQLLITSLVNAYGVVDAPFAAVTPAPKLEKKQAYSQRLIGYVSESGTYIANTCNTGYIWTTSDSYGKCCSTIYTKCNFVTSCSGKWVFDQSTAVTCTDVGYSCNTDFVYRSVGDATPVLYMGCATNEQHAYFQTPPTAIASVSSASSFGSIILSISSSRSSSSSTLTPSPASSTSTVTPSVLPVQEEKKSSSKAWIAGVVIGPLALIALAGLIFFFVKRRNKKNAAAPPPPQQGAYPPQGQAPYSPPPMAQQYVPPQGQQGYYPPQGQGQYPQSPPLTSPVPTYAESNQAWGQPNNPHDSMYKQPYVASQPVVPETHSPVPHGRDGAFELGSSDIQPVGQQGVQQPTPVRPNAAELR